MPQKTYPANYNYGTGAQPYYHMKGIDALPRVSAAQMRANGYDKTTRFFDEATGKWITPAQQQAKTGVLPTRIAGTERIVQKLDARKMIMDELKKKTEFKGPSVKAIRAAAKTGKTLHIVRPSTCFESINWKAGNVSVVFQNGYAYTAPLDLQTLMEWSDDPSLGSFFNHVLGQDFFAD
jgi:hypothetical protein